MTDPLPPPRLRDLPDDIVAELTERIYRSRIGVRWLILSTLPLSIFAMQKLPGTQVVAEAGSIWIAGLLRIVVAEVYLRHGSRQQPRAIQLRWQATYGAAGILLATAFAVFTIDMIMRGEAWLTAWSIATAIALSYGAIPYVALNPRFGSVQVAVPIVLPALALASSGVAVQVWMAFSLAIALVSVLQHIRIQFRATVAALLDQKRATHLAATDHLTGLWNRRQLEVIVRQALSERLTGLNWLGVDLDRFKQVNDELGHETGDHVLRKVAARIQAVAGDEAFVARVGGDEFVVLLIGDRAFAATVAERIAARLADPILVPAGVARIGASVGATAICPHDTIDEIARRADERMYVRKATGRLAA